MRLGCAYFLLCAGLVGCENPQPRLEKLVPDQANSESDVAITVEGYGFIPSSAVDPTTGARTSSLEGFRLRMGKLGVWGELRDVTWMDTRRLTAILPRELALGLPSGKLDVELVDPRGETAALSDGFHALGPDLVPPTIVIVAPSEKMAVLPGMLIKGTIVATDAETKVENLRWSYKERGSQRATDACVPGDGPCDFSVRVSGALRPGDIVEIVAEAEDASDRHNSVKAEVSLNVVLLPVADDVVPEKGGTSGGTDVVILGSGMLPGRTRALVDGQELFPNGGIVSSDGQWLSGHMPAHAAGFVKVAIITDDVECRSEAYFQYQPTPEILSIQPSSGSASGGTAVVIAGRGFRASTLVYFGSTLQTALPLRNQGLQTDSGNIVGHTPAGVGVTTVWAVDDELGVSALPGKFTWRAP